MNKRKMKSIQINSKLVHTYFGIVTVKGNIPNVGLIIFPDTRQGVKELAAFCGVKDVKPYLETNYVYLNEIQEPYENTVV